MSRINNVRYFHDSFSQNLKWWNTSDFILSSEFFQLSIPVRWNLWTVPDLGVWGLQVLFTLHWEIRGVCVCVGFVMCVCVCVCVCVFWQLCGCFGNMCNYIYTAFYFFCYAHLFFLVTDVRTTATEWKLNCCE
jgi:hypothetical protein